MTNAYTEQPEIPVSAVLIVSYPDRFLRQYLKTSLALQMQLYIFLLQIYSYTNIWE